MAVSLSTWLFDHLSEKEMARAVSRLDFENIEISGEQWQKKWKWERLVRETGRRRIRIRSVHCGHHEVSEEEWTERRFAKYHRDLYRMIGQRAPADAAPERVIVVEHLPGDPGKAERWLAILRELANENGLCLSVENVPNTAFEKSTDGRRWLGNGIGFTFDPAHAAYLNLDPLGFGPHLDHLVNVHVYDVDDLIGLGLGDWLPIGLGKIPWPKLFRAFRRARYGGPFTIELTASRFRHVLRLYERMRCSLKKMKQYQHLFSGGAVVEDVENLVAQISKNAVMRNARFFKKS
ncbi:MAG: sugar phosphate isomerase/epimerase [Verrucomicrobiae bacterium]|nr:sugar phosphate isomerase/epimerase [Verrucomicrobiae bacterium]